MSGGPACVIEMIGLLPLSLDPLSLDPLPLDPLRGASILLQACAHAGRQGERRPGGGSAGKRERTSGKWQATVIGRPKTRRLEAQYANDALKRDICASRRSPADTGLQ
ncbi:hypothetical protein KM043_017246 [Ampulex compressa]|nr:hypothetical protein KM043_017246 [Ampulex compressa]